MKNFLQVVVFSLLTIGAFWGFANFAVPRIEPAAPPKTEKLDLGSMTMEQFIVLGDKLYNGKGTCTLCHNSMGRAPMLDKIGSVGPERLADSRYQGEAKDIEAYLYESMIKPSAFVVAGFGKAGTNDTESPMPDVTGGAIGFSEAESKAVIAYLQDIGGAEVTVSIPTDVAADSDSDKKEGGAPRVPLTSPQEIFAHFTCNACHKVEGAGGVLGPDLSHIGGKKNAAYIRRAILDPNAEIAEGFAPMMPPTYGDQLYAKELETLVNYLAGLE
ncbi:MAG: c-type cytochrome [Pseudomonadota bacterium]